MSNDHIRLLTLIFLLEKRDQHFRLLMIRVIIIRIQIFIGVIDFVFSVGV